MIQPEVRFYFSTYRSAHLLCVLWGYDEDDRPTKTHIVHLYYFIYTIDIMILYTVRVH